MHQLSAVTWLSALAATAVSALDCILPECEACPPLSTLQAPGVGIELASSYGTVAVQYYNRTIDDVVRINGSGDYQDLFLRLSQSLAPPKPSFMDRWRRKLNKRLGKPATADVGTVAALLASLGAATEQHLQLPLNRVVVTAPRFPALTAQDLEDAIEYAGLRSWLIYPIPYPKMLYTPNAAYAANGRGQCKAWRHVYSCWDEATDGLIPRETVLGLALTDNMLLASVSYIVYAFQYERPEHHLATPELGYGSLTAYPTSETYWSAVTAQLKTFIVDMSKLGKHITDIVLMGEHGADPGFTAAIRDALARAETLNTSQIADPLWAASRGAAMYARIRQEVPWNCRIYDMDCEPESLPDPVTNDEL